MTLAERKLSIRTMSGSRPLAIRIAPPVLEFCQWTCTYEIDWPEGMRTTAAAGFDSIQALLLALQMIGSELYASDYHARGLLSAPGISAGYGFPVAASLRDLLVGDDREAFG